MCPLAQTYCVRPYTREINARNCTFEAMCRNFVECGSWNCQHGRGRTSAAVRSTEVSQSPSPLATAEPILARGQNNPSSAVRLTTQKRSGDDAKQSTESVRLICLEPVRREICFSRLPHELQPIPEQAYTFSTGPLVNEECWHITNNKHQLFTFGTVSARKPAFAIVVNLKVHLGDPSERPLHLNIATNVSAGAKELGCSRGVLSTHKSTSVPR